MASLQDVAKEVKAAVEIIDAVSELVEDAARSVVIEVNNATSRTLRRIPPTDGEGHPHGRFQSGALPKETIEPFKSDVFGSRSSSGALLVGTEGNVWYDVDGEGTRLHVRWVIPWAGGNESGMHVEGAHADFYTVRHIISGGNTKVQARYVIGENAALALSDPDHYRSDWRTCGNAKHWFTHLTKGSARNQKGVESHFRQEALSLYSARIKLQVLRSNYFMAYTDRIARWGGGSAVIVRDYSMMDM